MRVGSRPPWKKQVFLWQPTANSHRADSTMCSRLFKHTGARFTLRMCGVIWVCTKNAAHVQNKFHFSLNFLLCFASCVLIDNILYLNHFEFYISFWKFIVEEDRKSLRKYDLSNYYRRNYGHKILNISFFRQSR